MPPENESANVHDTGDCPVDCEHPDHLYEGDGEIDFEYLLELRQLAYKGELLTPFDHVLEYYGLAEEDLDLPDHEGPVEL